MELSLDVFLSLGRSKLAGVELLVFSLGLVVLLGRFNSIGVLSDFSVDLGEELFDGVNLGVLEGLVPLGELLLVSFRTLFLQVFHVGVDVLTEDSGLVFFRFVLVLFTFFFSSGETGESGFRVGDVDTTIASTLEDTEDSVTGGSSDQTSIQNSLEGLLVLDVVINVEVSTINLDLTSVQSVQTDLLEQSSSQQETSGVGRSVRGQTSVNTESSEFVRVSSAKDSVALEGGVDDLSDDSGVGGSSN